MILACSRTLGACGSSSNDSQLLDDEPMSTSTPGQQIELVTDALENDPDQRLSMDYIYPEFVGINLGNSE